VRKQQVVHILLRVLQRQQAEQAAEADDISDESALALPQLHSATRLHPKDPALEDLATAADYPHRFNTRPEGNPDLVRGGDGMAAAQQCHS
jgi:hypothetical protein